MHFWSGKASLPCYWIFKKDFQSRESRGRIIYLHCPFECCTVIDHLNKRNHHKVKVFVKLVLIFGLKLKHSWTISTIWFLHHLSILLWITKGIKNTLQKKITGFMIYDSLLASSSLKKYLTCSGFRSTRLVGNR